MEGKDGESCKEHGDACCGPARCSVVEVAEVLGTHKHVVAYGSNSLGLVRATAPNKCVNNDFSIAELLACWTDLSWS